MHGLLRRCRSTGTGRGFDTVSVCTVGAPAASDDGTGCTGLADTAEGGADDAVGWIVNVHVFGDGERAAPGVRVAVAFAGDVRAADGGEGGGDVRIYVSGGKGVLPVVTTTTNRSTPHVPASCDDHEPTPGL